MLINHLSEFYYDDYLFYFFWFVFTVLRGNYYMPELQ